jgi:hypothetical protein
VLQARQIKKDCFFVSRFLSNWSNGKERKTCQERLLLEPQGLLLSSNSRRKETKKTATSALDDPFHFSTEKESTRCAQTAFFFYPFSK